MHQSFLEASFKLERLSTYLADNESLKAVAAQFNQELSSREIDRVFSSAERRLTDYTYSIISLYGVFENFNESIIKAYVDLISILVKEYSEFPDRIRQSHLNMTASLILQKGQRKYDDITIESLVSNLDSCINQDGKFTINSGVFTQHTSNFRCDSLNMFYSSIAVEGIIRKVRTMKPFVEYQININGLLVSEVISSSDDKLFSELEDIVQRRNEIAHGVENGDLLELSILKQYISFMQALIESIYLVLKGEYDVFRFERVKKMT